jgi:hypothetical protein
LSLLMLICKILLRYFHVFFLKYNKVYNQQWVNKDVAKSENPEALSYSRLYYSEMRVQGKLQKCCLETIMRYDNMCKVFDKLTMSKKLCTLTAGALLSLYRLKPRASSSRGGLRRSRCIIFLTLSICQRPYTCCHTSLKMNIIFALKI